VSGAPSCQQRKAAFTRHNEFQAVGLAPPLPARASRRPPDSVPVSPPGGSRLLASRGAAAQAGAATIPGKAARYKRERRVTTLGIVTPIASAREEFPVSVEAISWALNLAPVPRDRGGKRNPTRRHRCRLRRRPLTFYLGRARSSRSGRTHGRAVTESRSPSPGAYRSCRSPRHDLCARARDLPAGGHQIGTVSVTEGITAGRLAAPWLAGKIGDADFSRGPVRVVDRITRPRVQIAFATSCESSA
jgi:hypothetical protein